MVYLVNSLVHSRTGDWSMTFVPIDENQEIFGMPDWWASDREEELRRWHDMMPKLPIWFDDFKEVTIMYLIELLKGKP